MLIMGRLLQPHGQAGATEVTRTAKRIRELRDRAFDMAEA